MTDQMWRGRRPGDTGDVQIENREKEEVWGACGSGMDMVEMGLEREIWLQTQLGCSSDYI